MREFDVLGHLSNLSRFAILATVSILMFWGPQILFAQETEFLLEGDGDSGITDYSLLLAVSGNEAKIAVKGRGCLGEMDAHFSRIDRLTWLLSSTGDGEYCEILLKEDGNGLIETIQGPGCSYYHGAICGFSGSFRGPASNGLAPIFDPMG